MPDQVVGQVPGRDATERPQPGLEPAPDRVRATERPQHLPRLVRQNEPPGRDRRRRIPPPAEDEYRAAGCDLTQHSLIRVRRRSPHARHAGHVAAVAISGEDDPGPVRRQPVGVPAMTPGWPSQPTLPLLRVPKPHFAEVDPVLEGGESVGCRARELVFAAPHRVEQAMSPAKGGVPVDSDAGGRRAHRLASPDAFAERRPEVDLLEVRERGAGGVGERAAATLAMVPAPDATSPPPDHRRREAVRAGRSTLSRTWAARTWLPRAGLLRAEEKVRAHGVTMDPWP